MEDITIDYKMKYVDLKVNNNYIYNISFQQIKGEGVDWWVKHLLEKNWFNKYDEQLFRETINKLKEKGYL